MKVKLNFWMWGFIALAIIIIIAVVVSKIETADDGQKSIKINLPSDKKEIKQ